MRAADGRGQSVAEAVRPDDPEVTQLVHDIEVFGVEVGSRQTEIELDRPFMARFGDLSPEEIARITIYTNTRRMAGALGEAFAAGAVVDGQAGIERMLATLHFEQLLNRFFLCSRLAQDAVPSIDENLV